MFFVMNDIDFASYVDDNTPYVSSDSIEDVVRILENDSIKVFKCFSKINVTLLLVVTNMSQ